MTNESEAMRRILTCAAKHRVLHTGERYDHCFIVISGLLVRERTLRDGRRQIVGLYVPGDVCGLTALTDGYADHDVVALSPVTYLPVTRRWVSSVACESLETSQIVWREMSRETAIAAAWIVNLGQRPAYQRLAHFICELEARIRASGQDTQAGFAWPGTQADLSAISGLSLVHVNRTLRRLENEKLASCGRRLKIHDLDRLGAVAGFEPAYLAIERESLGDVLISRIGEVGGFRNDNAFRPPPMHVGMSH